jgi:hypothetical protein
LVVGIFSIGAQVWVLALQWTITALGVVYLYLSGRKSWQVRRLGWTVALLTQPIWLGYAIATQQYAFILTSVLYGTVAFLNFRQAKPDSNHNSKSEDFVSIDSNPKPSETVSVGS